MLFRFVSSSGIGHLKKRKKVLNTEQKQKFTFLYKNLPNLT